MCMVCRMQIHPLFIPFIVFRQAIVGAPSGPTAVWRLPALTSAISGIFSATSLGGTGAYVRTELNSRHTGRVRMSRTLAFLILRHRSVNNPGFDHRNPYAERFHLAGQTFRSAPPTPISKRNRGLRVALAERPGHRTHIVNCSAATLSHLSHKRLDTPQHAEVIRLHHRPEILNGTALQLTEAFDASVLTSTSVGPCKGIGFETALAFARAGYRVHATKPGVGSANAQNSNSRLTPLASRLHPLLSLVREIFAAHGKRAVGRIHTKGSAMRLTDRTILITGGSASIRIAFTLKFLELGNQVIVPGRRESVLNQLRQDIQSSTPSKVMSQIPRRSQRFPGA